MVDKTNTEENLDAIFNIEGADALVEIINERAAATAEGEVLPPENKSKPKLLDKEVQEDYSYARNNLKSIIDNGEDALDSLIGIAKVSQHPRAFEVVGQLIKIIAETNKDLLDLKKQANDLHNNIPDNDKTKISNVTNALFVGSTKELQQMIKGATVPSQPGTNE
jgi:hypothetical protein